VAVVTDLVLAGVQPHVVVAVVTGLVLPSVQRHVVVTVVAGMLLTTMQSHVAAIGIISTTCLDCGNLIAIPRTRSSLSVGAEAAVVTCTVIDGAGALIALSITAAAGSSLLTSLAAVGGGGRNRTDDAGAATLVTLVDALVALAVIGAGGLLTALAAGRVMANLIALVYALVALTVIGAGASTLLSGLAAGGRALANLIALVSMPIQKSPKVPK